MILGFKIEGGGSEALGILSKYGRRPGALSDWDKRKTVKELRFWRDQGLEVVEIDADINSKTGPFFRYTLDEWRETRKVVEDGGVRFEGCLAWRRMISRQPWKEEKWEDMLHIADVSEALGVKIVTVFVSPPYTWGHVEGRPLRPTLKSLWDATDRDFEESAEKLKTYCKRLADFGAALTLEIHEDSINDCAPSALRLLHMIDEPNVGINPDSLDNAWLYPGEDVPDAVEQARMVAPYVNYWHVKQFTRRLGSDGEWKLGPAHADEGSQPIGTYAQIFAAAGFDGAVIHECGHGEDKPYNLIRFRNYFRWLLDEVIPNVPAP
jgi:sugar phosphate isomerase/epimerase